MLFTKNRTIALAVVTLSAISICTKVNNSKVQLNFSTSDALKTIERMAHKRKIEKTISLR